MLKRIENECILFCFVGPIASGKSTICEKVLAEVDRVKTSISKTSRAPRPGDVEGKDYFFVSREQFEKEIASGGFVEHAEFSGNYYGTPKTNIEASFSAGSDLLLDIEVQGVRQLKELYPERVVVIFVCPPSLAVLKQRASARAADSKEVIDRRLEDAKVELRALSDSSFSDYLLVNDQLEDAMSQARAIILSERLRLSRRLGDFMSDFLG